jgi:UDP-glucose 4-epimerase
VSKLAAENLVAAYTGISDFDAVILRYFSVYGPRQRPDMAYHIFIERLLEDRPIVVFGDGRQSRSNTYVTDCVEGTIRALSSPVNSGVFNIAGGERITLLEAIQILADELGVKPRLEFVDSRPGDQRTTAGDWSAAHKAFGYEPTSSLEHGLREQAKWHLGQRSEVIGSR